MLAPPKTLAPAQPALTGQTARINRIYRTLALLYPNPQTELYYTNGYTLLIAIAMSAQTTDVAVNKITQHLFELIKTPHDTVAMGEQKLKDYIKTIGLFNSKAKNLMIMAQQLIDRFQGEVPTTRKELMALAGVGRKTANVWLNIQLNQPTVAVDTHVLRVSNRLGLANSPNPKQVEVQLIELTPKKYLLHSHIRLILHGRSTCKALKPLCKVCPLNQDCEYYSRAN